MADLRSAKGCDVQIRAPGSKSCTLRGMVAGALGRGKTVLTDAILCEDTEVMARALTALGISVGYEGGAFSIEGCGGGLANPGEAVDMGNSGAPLRFLTALVALGQGRYLITGDERMRQRPVQDLLDALDGWGVRGHTLHRNGCPPVLIEAHGIGGGRTRLKGERSSQFLSALLLAAPYARAESEIEVQGRLVSRPYADLTIEVMEAFGITVRRDGYRHFAVSPARGYEGRRFPIEGDWSSASYFFAAAAMTRGRATVTGLNPRSSQADRGFLKVLEEMGCRVEVGDDRVVVEGGELRGLEVEMRDMPDLVPTLAVIAPFARGETVVRGVAHLRIKESDRIRTLAEELRTVGGVATEMEDGLVIQGSRPRAGRVKSHGDHRIAMAFGVLGLAVPGVEVEGKGCVKKSYPSFWDELGRITG